MNDQATLRLVIFFLGGIGLLVIGGGIYLVAQDHQLPDALIAMGAGAIASLGTILANPQTRNGLGGDEGQANYWPLILVFIIGFLLGALCYSAGIIGK